MIPVIHCADVTVTGFFSTGCFTKLMIQKDGFYCRTNPFDGRYYRYSDILDWLSCRVAAEDRLPVQQRKNPQNVLRLRPEIH